VEALNADAAVRRAGRFDRIVPERLQNPRLGLLRRLVSYSDRATGLRAMAIASSAIDDVLGLLSSRRCRPLRNVAQGLIALLPEDTVVARVHGSNVYSRARSVNFAAQYSFGRNQSRKDRPSADDPCLIWRCAPVRECRSTMVLWRRSGRSIESARAAHRRIGIQRFHSCAGAEPASRSRRKAGAC